MLQKFAYIFILTNAVGRRSPAKKGVLRFHKKIFSTFLRISFRTSEHLFVI